MGETNSYGYWFDAVDCYFLKWNAEYLSYLELFWNIPNVNKPHLFMYSTL